MKNLPTVTVVLLNWKRPENLKKVIESIKKQKKVDVKIHLWNNNVDCDEFFDVDMQIDSDENYICMPRWFMASMTKSEYIMTLDDDLLLTEPYVIYNLVSVHRAYPTLDNLIVGPYGRNFGTNGYNGEDNDFNHIEEDTRVDIIKGRCMFMKRELLERVKLHDPGSADDIYINSFSEHRIIPRCIRHGFEDLPEGNEALSADPQHYISRAKASQKYFKLN